MSFSRIALLFCIAFLALPARAGAVENSATFMPDFGDPSFTTCQSDDQCLVIHPACSAPIVVNALHFGQVDTYYKNFGEHVTCDSALLLPKVKSKKCLLHRCTLELTDAPVPEAADAKVQKDPSYCDKDDECRLVLGDCCAKNFVNKQAVPRLTAEIKAKADLATCFYWDRRHVKNLRCEKHKCTADLEVPNEAVDDSRHTLKDRCEQ